MTHKSINNLKCYVLPGHIRDCKPEFHQLYGSAYRFWRVFMGYEMNKEHLEDIEKKLSSDAFMLFEDIFTLFHGNSIVGFFCFDTKDMHSPAICDQSFFKSFPEDVLDNYIMPADKIMTIGHLLVHPDWRRSKIGVGLSDILVWFMHKRFVESGSDLMIYWTRNNRSTNQLGVKFGGEAIVQNQEYGGLTADIIATRPENVVMDCGDPTVNQISERLWENLKYGHIRAKSKVSSKTKRKVGSKSLDKDSRNKKLNKTQSKRVKL